MNCQCCTHVNKIIIFFPGRAVRVISFTGDTHLVVMSLLLIVILGLSFGLPTVFGFNWSYPVAPRQCSTFTVNLTDIDNDVVFPLKVLIVPVGPSPLTYEVRKVMEVAFPSNKTIVSFQLPYPTGSKFIGMVSVPWSLCASGKPDQRFLGLFLISMSFSLSWL